MTITVNKIKSLIINGELTMAEQKVPRIDEVEELLVLKQHRAKPQGALTAKVFFPGEKYKISGLDKLEVLGGVEPKCSRDLKFDYPVNQKRKAPGKGEEKFTDPVAKLSAKLDSLIDLLKPLLTKR